MVGTGWLMSPPSLAGRLPPGSKGLAYAPRRPVPRRAVGPSGRGAVGGIAITTDRHHHRWPPSSAATPPCHCDSRPLQWGTVIKSTSFRRQTDVYRSNRNGVETVETMPKRRRMDIDPTSRYPLATRRGSQKLQFVSNFVNAHRSQDCTKTQKFATVVRGLWLLRDADVRSIAPVNSGASHQYSETSTNFWEKTRPKRFTTGNHT